MSSQVERPSAREGEPPGRRRGNSFLAYSVRGELELGRSGSYGVIDNAGPMTQH